MFVGGPIKSIFILAIKPTNSYIIKPTNSFSEAITPYVYY
jgi:hypothetical protein